MKNLTTELERDLNARATIDPADKRMLLVAAIASLLLALIVLMTSSTPADVEKVSAGVEVPAEYVWVDTEYCTPADGGLLCEVDPYSLHPNK